MKLPWRQLMSFETRSFLPVAGGASGLRGPYAKDHVHVRLSPTFNRRQHPDAGVEAAVDSTWTEYLRASPRLFNATKFRLQDWRPSTGGGLELQFGLTDYKTYLGTCCSTAAPRLLQDGESGGDRFAFLSRKVGVAAVVETADAQVALIQRSKSVGLYQNLRDTPGGHPEPSHIGVTWEVLDALSKNEAQRKEFEIAARDEFFQSIVNEVHEEINLAPADQSAPLLLGVVLQTAAWTPSFSFYIRTPLSAAKLHELYRAGPADKFESQRLDLLDAGDLLTQGSSSSLLDSLQLTPSARGTLSLWQQYKRSDYHS